MSASSGAGAAKLRQPGDSKAQGLEPSALLAENSSRYSNLRPQHVLEALHEARRQVAINPDGFRRTQQGWLRTELPQLLTATGSMFELAHVEHGPKVADAALQGAMLGTLVMRTAVEQGAILVDECRANIASWDIGRRGIVHNDDMPTETIIRVFGAETAAAFMDIKTPAARTMACLVVGLALAPKPQSG